MFVLARGVVLEKDMDQVIAFVLARSQFLGGCVGQVNTYTEGIQGNSLHIWPLGGSS